MMRSLFAGVSGLNSHQTRMDVIGNNISNVNTVGFKSSSVTFQETLSQLLSGASAPQGSQGGINPIQVGLGVSVASINVNHTQGNLQSTGKVTDIAIQGNGFFILADGSSQYYTRAGNFGLDAVGTMVDSSSGLIVQGWMADTNGTINTNSNIGNIQLPVGQTIPSQATTKMEFEGNLNSASAVGDSTVNASYVYDSLGNKNLINTTFTKTDDNEWAWEATDADGNTLGSGTLTFNTDGSFDAVTGGTINLTPSGANALTITPDFTDLTQGASSTSEISLSSQDGYPMGTLESYTINSYGQIVGSFSNGMSQTLAQLALANFNNPAGLMSAGSSLYTSSSNSGTAQIGAAGGNGRGLTSAGYLEMSNVDLAQEFTNMITTQRGYQANSRIITTSDEMLQELVNLKR